jgi:beta-N-acetylhexosaminidase
LFASFADVEFVRVPDLRMIDAATFPADGRVNVLASNHRTRFGPGAATAHPDLHLALWNPYQLLDIVAPAVVTWGYADGALAALKAWLEGTLEVRGTSPVKLAPRAA